jgi:RNA polymerase-binding transcription factor DksA
MATTRKKSAAGKAPSKGKAAPKAKAAKPKAGPKPVARKAAPKPVKSARPSKPVKPAPKAAKPAKPVKSAKSQPKVAKPAPKPAAKPVAKPVKGAAKLAPKAAGAKTLNKGAAAAKALAEARAKAAAEAAAKAAAAAGPRKLVPATAEAKAAALRAAKPTTGKGSKTALRPAPEVRPLGVLPVESQAKPRFTTPIKPVPARVVPVARPIVAARPAPKAGDDRLSKADLKHFEERLRQEYARIMREMGHIEDTLLKVNPNDAGGDTGAYSFHMADAGTDSMEREKAFDLASKEGKLLREIKDALVRMYNGTYGICEVSNKPISRTRLEALPWARLCIEEQEKYERDLRMGRLTAKDE